MDLFRKLINKPKSQTEIPSRGVSSTTVRTPSKSSLAVARAPIQKRMVTESTETTGNRRKNWDLESDSSSTSSSSSDGVGIGNKPGRKIQMMPPRGTAFQAPLVDLPPPNATDTDEGLKFSFEPKANYRTEISFTVEPRKTPAWQTMMRCGFVPMIPAQVPPYSIGNYVSHPLTIQNPPAFHYSPAPPTPAVPCPEPEESSEDDTSDDESSSGSSYSSSTDESSDED